jgi:hypothetical protein
MADYCAPVEPSMISQRSQSRHVSPPTQNRFWHDAVRSRRDSRCRERTTILERGTNYSRKSIPVGAVGVGGERPQPSDDEGHAANGATRRDLSVPFVLLQGQARGRKSEKEDITMFFKASSMPECTRHTVVMWF